MFRAASRRNFARLMQCPPDACCLLTPPPRMSISMSMSTNPAESAHPAADPETDADSDAGMPPQSLPDWAQETPRRRRLLSRRNLAIAIVALVVIGFVTWLNFPFIPDPVILLTRQPDLLVDSAGTGAQWTMPGALWADPVCRRCHCRTAGPARLARPHRRPAHPGRAHRL